MSGENSNNGSAPLLEDGYDDGPWTREELQALAWERVKHEDCDEYESLPAAMKRSDVVLVKDIDCSNEHFDVASSSGDAARRAAEEAAKKHLQR